MKSNVTLIVLPPSHYCERARWALSWAGIAHSEEKWAVGLHIPLAKRIAPGTSLPILRAGNQVIQGSGAILDWIDLPGGDRNVEQRFERKIGALVRQYVYVVALPDSASNIRQMLLTGVPTWQALAGRALWPITKRAMARAMDIRAEIEPQLRADIDRELDWFERRLQGASYLSDGRFGRTDLTAASLLTPIARPPEIALYRRAPNSTLTEALNRWSNRESVSWVRQIYAAHRAETMAR